MLRRLLLSFIIAENAIKINSMTTTGSSAPKLPAANKNLPEYNDDMYSQPVKFVTLTEKTAEINGRKININRWVPDGEAKAIVLVSHGLHEHGRRYHVVAEVLAQQKYLVIAPDHYAHGLSEGTRGLIIDYKFLIEDFVSLCKTSHNEYPNLPFFIVSHSMGTLVSLMSIKELPFLKVCFFRNPSIQAKSRLLARYTVVV
jgi:predicted alpha/beta hydrolase